eukprot:159172-Amphidinium_carterae.1
MRFFGGAIVLQSRWQLMMALFATCTRRCIGCLSQSACFPAHTRNIKVACGTNGMLSLTVSRIKGQA